MDLADPCWGLHLGGIRNGVVHKIFVCKPNSIAQFYLHTALHRKKFVNFLHRTANTAATQNTMANGIA